MSAGTRSSAITAQAPASSAILACSALTTSMITPPLSISARPLFTRIVPYSAMSWSLASASQAAVHGVECDRQPVPRRRGRDEAAVRGEAGDEADGGGVRGHALEPV